MLTLRKLSRHLLSLFYALFALFLVVSMLVWPEETFTGARFGLELWANILVPSLLPFFIIAEVLIGLGVVSMLGILLEPVMRPLFNLPGAASFVVAMGFMSGFPMGAVLSRRLYEEGECTAAESERLIAFTNNSSPLFILGAVAVGMFRQPELGVTLALSHYLSNLLIGIIMGLSAPKTAYQKKREENIVLASLRMLVRAQKRRKPWGKLLGDAILKGVNTICLVGGFVIFFAVLIRILRATSILAHINWFFSFLLTLFGFDPTYGIALTTGFLEMTLGLQQTSVLHASWREKAVISSILLGWSGLSIQSQVASVIAGSGLKVGIYYRCRILQGLLGGIIAYFLT